MEDLLDTVDRLKPAQLLPLLDAEAARARARLSAHRNDHEPPDRFFRRAIGLFRELETSFYLARVQLKYAQQLTRMGRDAAGAGTPRGEAVAVFEALGAKPWLARARSLQTAVAA